MNNSKFAIDSVFEEPVVDRKPELREQESKLLKIIEALGEVSDSKGWSTLKNTVFEGVIETLERQLKTEALKESPNLQTLAKIQGQLIWAKKYIDLNSLSQVFRLELTNVRKQLYGKTQENS